MILHVFLIYVLLKNDMIVNITGIEDLSVFTLVCLNYICTHLYSSYEEYDIS